MRASVLFLCLLLTACGAPATATPRATLTPAPPTATWPPLVLYAPYPAPVVVVYEAKAGAPAPCGTAAAPYWLIRFGSDPAEYLPCDTVQPTLGPAPTPLPERPYVVRSWLGVVLRGARVP